jgi:hypothetical protein
MNVRFLVTVAFMIVAPKLAGAERRRDTPWLQPTLTYEVGPGYIAQNDGRYGEGGTPYEAADVGQRDSLVNVARASLELAHGDHRLILLYAPLDVTTEVELTKDLRFRDELFAAGTLVTHRYLFDGYRASYLYRLVERRKVGLEVGASLQIRNAIVAFSDGSRRAQQNDIGLVGALKLRLWLRPHARGPWGAIEADGFSTFGLVDGVSGGIYDVQVSLGHPIGRGIDVVLGVRLLGGGANVRDQAIDNWANFVIATAGFRVALDQLVGP